MNEHLRQLMGRPSVVSPRCAVCGRRATDKHHVIPKGIGGVSRETDKAIPLVSLCRACHEDAHAHRLHLFWADSMGGWVHMRTPHPMNDFQCWRLHRRDYKPLPGWTAQKAENVIGRRS